MITELPKEIFVKIDDREEFIKTELYIIDKIRSLRDFGYPDLKKETVEKEFLKVLNDSKELTVIGMFIEGDVIARPIKEG